MTKFRFWLAKHLRYFADRIDYEHAMVRSMYQFEIVPGYGDTLYKTNEVPPSNSGVQLWHRVDEYAEKREEWFKE